MIRHHSPAVYKNVIQRDFFHSYTPSEETLKKRLKPENNKSEPHDSWNRRRGKAAEQRTS